MEGIVVDWEESTEGSGGKLEDGDGNWWRVGGSQVEPDCIGRTFLIVGEPVLFDLGDVWRKENRKHVRIARNIRRPQKETGIDWRAHREWAEILDANWIIRIRGGRLRIPFGLAPRPAQVVRCGACPSDESKIWEAYDIQVVHGDGATFDWASVPIDGETVTMPVEETSSVLLTDEFRGKPLRDIGIRRTS